MGLAPRAKQRPGSLSGGHQQLVAVARAITGRPAILLADEPTGNLDENTRDEIMGLLGQLWRERGLTMVIVTHDSSVARRARHLGLMREGRLEVRPAEPAGTGSEPAGAGSEPAGAGAGGLASA